MDTMRRAHLGLVALVKNQTAVELRAAAPVNQHVNSLHPAARRQASVRAEHGPIAEVVRASRAVGYVRHVADGNTGGANVLEIARGVGSQVCARREPHRLLAPAPEILEDEARDLPALANARTVADQETAELFRGQHDRMAHAGVYDGLELQPREQAAYDQLPR
jgi:hypothetical protein